MTAPLKPNVLWTEVVGTFLCACGESTDLDDCMLPATVVCDRCGQFYTVSFKVTSTKYQPRIARCRRCGDEFWSHSRRGGKPGSYVQTCTPCRKGPKLEEVARKLGMTKQAVHRKLKIWRGQNPEMKRADVLRLMMERANG